MQNKTRALFIALIGIAVLIAAPAAAENLNIAAGITPSFTFSVNATPAVMPNFVIGTNDITLPNTVSVISNTPYTIKCKDGMIGGSLPAGSEGKMKGLIGVTHTGSFLTNAIQISVNGSYYAMTGADQVIRTGSAESYTSPIKVRQVIVAADPVIAGGNYDITLTITGAATA